VVFSSSLHHFILQNLFLGTVIQWLLLLFVVVFLLGLFLLVMACFFAGDGMIDLFVAMLLVLINRTFGWQSCKNNYFLILNYLLLDY
jgi:hypothetical protein